MQKKKIENWRAEIFFFFFFSSDAFIKFEWLEPEDHSSTSVKRAKRTIFIFAKKKIENYRAEIFSFANLKLFATMRNKIENDDRDNAFIKFKWPKSEDDSSISEDMACAKRVHLFCCKKEKKK